MGQAQQLSLNFLRKAEKAHAVQYLGPSGIILSGKISLRAI